MIDVSSIQIALVSFVVLVFALPVLAGYLYMTFFPDRAEDLLSDTNE